MRKTGTSSIQFLLRDNRDRLADVGVLFPCSPGRARHTRLGLFAQPDDELSGSIEWPREKQPDPTTFRETFRRELAREIEDSGLDRVLFSDEVLFGASEATLSRLGRFTNGIGRSSRVVVYLRRQDDHMVSAYQQGVKVGWVQRLAEWADEDMSDLYDYAARLRMHERHVAPTALIVRAYDGQQFLHGSLYEDFFDAASIDLDVAALQQGPHRNPSLDAESVEFLRLVNLWRVENEGATPGLIDNRAISRRLADASTGPVLSLPGARLDEFMQRWAESNEFVASHYLPGSRSELFRTSRKADGITTDQRLDPARLDRFLEVVRLPERMHRPLRRIAERESR